MRRTVFALLFCLLWLAPAQAGSLTLGEPGYGGNWHYSAPNFVVTASLMYQPGAYNVTLHSFTININGIDYNATTTPVTNGFSGSVTIPRTANPQRLVCYAIASVTWTYYNTYTENLDSRDPVSGQNQLGDGKKQERILSDIKLKGLTWKNRPSDLPIYEHETSYRVAGTYPNAAHPFHWQQFRDSNGNPTTSEQHGAVYLMAGAPTLEIETEPLDSGVEVRAKPKIEFYSNSSIGNQPAGYPFNGIAPLGGSVGSLVCPALPNEVNLYSAAVTVNFECKFLNGTWKPIYGRPNDEVNGLRVYIIYAMPGAPMTTPWEGVLNDACSWAEGQSTAATVAEKLTTGFYFSQRAYYDPSNTYCRSNIAPKTFRLTAFLNGLTLKTSLGLSYMDCRDVSDYLSIVANSQGLGFTVAPYESNPGLGSTAPGGFQTNNLCPMPRDPAVNSNYGPPYGFNFHQITHSGTGTVYDASNAQLYDLSGNSFRNPPFNWPLAVTSSSPTGYWQTNLLSGTAGLVDLPNPSAPTSYAFIGPYTPAVE